MVLVLRNGCAERGLRKALQQEFDTDLSQEKDFIRAEVG